MFVAAWVVPWHHSCSGDGDFWAARSWFLDTNPSQRSDTIGTVLPKFFLLQSWCCPKEISSEMFCSVLLTRDEVLDGKKKVLARTLEALGGRRSVHESLLLPQHNHAEYRVTF